MDTPDDSIPPRHSRPVWHFRLARSLAACAAAAAASLAASWLLSTAQPLPHVPSAIVRESVPAGPAFESIMEALRSPEHLAAALRSIGAAQEADLQAAGENPYIEQVLDRLHITSEVAPMAKRRSVAVRYAGDETCRWSAALVNKLADDYVAGLRSRVESRAHSEFVAAQTAAVEAEASSRTAREAIDTWLAGRLALRTLEPADESEDLDTPDDGAIESPPGKPLDHELAELEGRREALLQRLTPAHPDVKALDLEIAELKEKADGGEKIDGLDSPPGDEPIASPTRVHRHAAQGPSIAWDDQANAQWLKLRREAAEAASRQAELNEEVRRAAEALASARSTDVAEMMPALAPPAAGTRAQWREGAVVISIGLLAAWAVVAAWPARAGAVEPPSTHDGIAEFETELGVGVLGVISFDDRRRSWGGLPRPSAEDDGLGRPSHWGYSEASELPLPANLAKSRDSI